MKKVILYKSFLYDRRNLSADECIVYSYLVYSCISECSEAWDKDSGDFDDYSLKENGGMIEIPISLINIRNNSIHCSRIAESLGVNKSTISRALQKLETKDYIYSNEQRVLCDGIYDNGYFELKMDSGLKGELLIFYSWLLDLKKDKPAIYAKREKIASMYNKPLEYIRDYLQRLRKLGLIERGKNLELIIK